MNTILIISDTFRKDHLGCYGNDWIKTPNLDRLAANGVVFDRAYTGSYATVPARADVHTGTFVFPHHGWEPFTYADVTLSTVLGEAGFTTHMVVDTPHIMKDGFNFDRGFSSWEWVRGQESDRYITDATLKIEFPCSPHKLRNPYTVFRQHMQNISFRRGEEDCFCAITMRKGIEWLTKNYMRDRWLLVLDTFDPHEPWDPPEYYIDMYDPDYTGERVPYPAYGKCDYLTERELQNVRALYAAEATLVDRWIGELLDHVDRLGLTDRVMIIFWTDHGFMLGEHGLIGKGNSPLYSELNDIPFIIRMPDGLKGARCDKIVQAADIMPTILEAAGVPIPDCVTGKSLIPLLKGEDMETRDIAVSSWQLLAKRPNVLSVITDEEWSLHYYGKGGDHELYHMKTDPKQQKNLIAEKREIAEELLEKYVAFLRELDCPTDILELRSEL